MELFWGHQQGTIVRTDRGHQPEVLLQNRHIEQAVDVLTGALQPVIYMHCSNIITL